MLRVHNLQAAIIVKRCLQCVEVGCYASEFSATTSHTESRHARRVISMKVSVGDNDNATGLLHPRGRSLDALSRGQLIFINARVTPPISYNTHRR